MIFYLNGKKIKWDKNSCLIIDILEKYNYSLDAVAVLVNDEIVKKDLWKNFQISNGDKIEVVGFVGGG